MKKIWFEEAWEDYLYWQGQDKKTMKRINALILRHARHENDKAVMQTYGFSFKMPGSEYSAELFKLHE